GHATNVRWLVFVLSCGTSWTLYLHRYVFGLIKPKLAREWEVSNAELGVIESAFFFCYTFFQVPAGLLVDMAGPHLFLPIAMVLGSSLLALQVLSPGLTSLFFLHGGLGAAQAGVYP